MAAVFSYHTCAASSVAGPPPGHSLGRTMISGRSYAQPLVRPLHVPLAAHPLPFLPPQQVGMPFAPTSQLRLHSQSNHHSPVLSSLRCRPLQLPLLILEVNFLRQLLKFWGITILGPEVFLSFRGPDTRTGFACFLWKFLEAAGVSVYWDSRDIPMGEPIGKELLQAVRSCRIAMPIFSLHFVESSWCNWELAEMMKCHREHGLLVIPIYYKVNYNDVGCQRGKFGEDLCKLEKWLGKEEVLKFVEALTSVSTIRGWSSQTIADGQEAELVVRVAIKVLNELKMMFLKQLPSFVRSVCLNILEKNRRESECQVLLVVDDQDIEFGFADYLKVSLEVVGIRVFTSDDPCLLGKYIAHEIDNAIDKCIICIPIVTENFDSSHSFLERIVPILERKKTNGQKVCPIFLNVMPSQLKKVSLHKDLKGGSACEQALKELASFRGWVSNDNANRKHGELVMEVVKYVLSYVSSLSNNP